MSTLSISALIFSVGILAGTAGCTKGSKTEGAPKPAATAAEAAPVAASGASSGAPAAATAPPGIADLTPDGQGLSKTTVVLKTNKGTLKFKLYSKDAPNTVAKFVELVHAKFYNGLSYHRIIPGFIVQTGDPRSKNKNDPEIGHASNGPKLKAEFNGRHHVRGTVAMARVTSDPDSADTQFYITLGTFPHLDDKYTVFGQVVDYGEKIGDKDVLDRLVPWDDVVDMHLE